MVAALNETLLEESRVPAVVADVQTLIDAEVSDKSGASGLALKPVHRAGRRHRASAGFRGKARAVLAGILGFR